MELVTACRCSQTPIFVKPEPEGGPRMVLEPVLRWFYLKTFQKNQIGFFHSQRYHQLSDYVSVI